MQAGSAGGALFKDNSSTKLASGSKFGLPQTSLERMGPKRYSDYWHSKLVESCNPSIYDDDDSDSDSQKQQTKQH